jgi:hypothetical protein
MLVYIQIGNMHIALGCSSIRPQGGKWTRREVGSRKQTAGLRRAARLTLGWVVVFLAQTAKEVTVGMGRKEWDAVMNWRTWFLVKLPPPGLSQLLKWARWWHLRLLQAGGTWGVTTRGAGWLESIRNDRGLFESFPR